MPRCWRWSDLELLGHGRTTSAIHLWRASPAARTSSDRQGRGLIRRLLDLIEFRAQRPSRLAQPTVIVAGRWNPQFAGKLAQKTNSGILAHQRSRHVRKVNQLDRLVTEQGDNHGRANGRRGHEFKAHIRLHWAGNLNGLAGLHEIGVRLATTRRYRHRARINLGELPGRVDVEQDQITRFLRRYPKRHPRSHRNAGFRQHLKCQFGRVRYDDRHRCVRWIRKILPRRHIRDRRCRPRRG